MIKTGFIGTGNMGGAVAVAVSKNQDAKLLLANRSPEKARKLAAEIGGDVCDNKTAAKEAKYIFIGVKPQFTEAVLKDLSAELAARNDRFILVSMVAGWTMERIRKAAGADYPVIRIMPNTPAMIGEGMILYSYTDDVAGAEIAEFLELMDACGRFTLLAENLIDAASAVTGCGPAFADMFVDALADGAVLCGIPRKQAIEFAAQMLVGSGKLILETGKHPDQLKDEVCSPAGSTIEGVIALENGGFRSAVISAVKAACDKNRKL